MKKMLIILLFIGLIFGYIYSFYRDSKAHDLLQNSVTTHATIVDFGGVKGTCYIYYEYVVDGKKIKANRPAAGNRCKDEYIGLHDLEIIYAVENHELSEVVDKRFR